MIQPALLSILFSLVALIPSQESSAVGGVSKTRSIAFKELPGEREFSGQLIVRPHQWQALRAEGLSLREAGALRSGARRLLQQVGVERYIPATDESLVRVPSGWDDGQLAAELLETGLYEYAEPDWILAPLSAGPQQTSNPSLGTRNIGYRKVNCPDDPAFGFQWHHRAEFLGSCRAWTLGTGSPTISVGVCDTGIRTTHEDLSLHRLEGYNAVDRLWESQNGNINAVHYHGTRTTGVLAANGNNGLGVVGVGWNLSHRMLRVSNESTGNAQLSVLQHAARTSIESGDRIANVSYHGAYFSSNVATGTYIQSLGGLMVWGAGNSSANYSGTDRDSDDFIVVGATDDTDTLWGSSSFGSFVDLVAPGVAIHMTDSGSDTDYATASGTSYASPLTAGVCAMIWDQRPTLSPTDVERILKANTTDLGAAGIDNFYGYGRISLLQSLSDNAPQVPQSELGAYPASGAVPLAVNFRDLSTGVPASWLWDFGDGTTSTLQNPSHTYTTPAAYTVTLTVTNALGADQVTNLDAILADVIPPIADFVASPTAGLSPLSVNFTDQSLGGTSTSWLWDFGDGGSSTLQNPSHVYLTSDVFTVSLAATNAYGTDQRIETGFIAVDYIPPIADFSAVPTSGNSPMVVQFTDESVGGIATSWSWSFGDGLGSNAQNPSHTYVAEGSYTVRLEASNIWGMNELVRTDFVTVGAGPSILANFTGQPTTGTAPLTVTFTDLSVGNITEWEWNFGDGVTSDLPNPTHTFTSSGDYDVALQVGNASGSDDQLELQHFVIVQ